MLSWQGVFNVEYSLFGFLNSLIIMLNSRGWGNSTLYICLYIIIQLIACLFINGSHYPKTKNKKKMLIAAALAKRRREGTESEKEDQAMESAAQSGDTAYIPDRSAKSVNTKELTDEEAESKSIGLREG